VFDGSTHRALAHGGGPFDSGTEALPLGWRIREAMDAGGDTHLLEHAWDRWRPATCMPDRCFCEPVRDGVIRQPVNTWSNLAFVLVGLMVIGVGSRDLVRSSGRAGGASNPIRTQPVSPMVYGVAAISIGLCSMLYHSSMAFAGQAIDVLSMYLMTGFMVLYNVSRLRRMDDRVFLACYVVMNVSLGYASIQWPILRRYIFVALMVAALVSEAVVCWRRRPKANVAFLYGALVSLVGACTMWILDVTRIVCAPDSWFQGHAMWHVLMAAVIGFIYLYYCSDVGGLGVGVRGGECESMGVRECGSGMVVYTEEGVKCRA